MIDDLPTTVEPLPEVPPSAPVLPAESVSIPEPETKSAEAAPETEATPESEAAPAPAEEAEASAPSAEETSAAVAPTPAANNKRWYAVKVQSNREETIKDAIERRVKIDGLEEFFGQIIIPVERIPEIRRGKKVFKDHKLYPGYLMVECDFNDRILYLFRETSGVGDFVGGGLNRLPPPLTDHEVERMLRQHLQGTPDVSGKPAPTRAAAAKPRFSVGDRLKVKDGTFSGMEGEVVDILEEKGLVKLEVTIIGRKVGVEVEYWQAEPV